MYDYMKALQKRFDRQEHSELDKQVEYAQEELRRDMDATERKKLLRLLDAQNTLLAESTLMSFTAGFKLAWGMAKELEADGLYSFEKEEEDHICHPAEQVENGKLELVGVYPHKYWGVMNGSTRVRCDDYPIYRYSDLLLMLAEAKVLLGEDPATEINRVRRRAFGDAYDASTVGFPNQEVDKRPADAVLQERLFEFMLEGKRWYDLRRFGDSYVLDYTPAEPARLLWPINQGALTNNPLLKQTVGY